MPTCVHLNSIDGCLPTYDATPTQILAVPCFEPYITMRVEVQIIARSMNNVDAKTWQQLLLIDKTAGATPTQAANINLMAPAGTLGAETWTFSVTFDTNHVLLNVIGQAASTINWMASAWGMQVMGD